MVGRLKCHVGHSKVSESGGWGLSGIVGGVRVMEHVLERAGMGRGMVGERVYIYMCVYGRPEHGNGRGGKVGETECVKIGVVLRL